MLKAKVFDGIKKNPVNIKRTPKKICFFTTIPPLMYYVFVPKVFSTLDFVKKIPGEHDYKMFLQI